MYSLMEANASSLVGFIDHVHVDNYDWLMANRGSVGDPVFQSRFRLFWRMNAARLGDTYCNHYFELLSDLSDVADLEDLVRELYKVPVNNKGTKALQFSFSTKLLHMHDPHLPIYDKQVAAFYFYSAPSSRSAFDSRLTSLMRFHNFLQNEYARIADEHLLSESIHLFRSRLEPRFFTDEKVIDSLIWAFVALLRGGRLVDGSVRYM